MIQIPSIGRIVHYQSHGSPNGQHKSEPRPAIITSVDPEDLSTCDMTIFNPTGMFFSKVKMADTPTAGCWNFDPNDKRP